MNRKCFTVLTLAALALLVAADSSYAQQRGGRGARWGRGMDWNMQGQPGLLPGQGAMTPNAQLATIELRVPENAEVLFDNQLTGQLGSTRRFQTPPLDPEGKYSYDIRVRWLDNGQQKEESRRLILSGGSEAILDLINPQAEGTAKANPEAPLAGTGQAGERRSFYVEPLPAQSTTGTIELRCPPNAEVLINGERTSLTGMRRQFLTPPLDGDKEYKFQVQVRWLDMNGQMLELTRILPVKAGSIALLDLFAPPAQ